MPDSTDASRLREWLQRNKVIFETVAAVLLSAMAIVISAVEALTGVRQTRLLELQTSLAESQVVPQLALDAQGATDTFERTLRLVNHGGYARNITVELAQWILCSETIAQPGYTMLSGIHIPITGYATVTTPPRDGVGTVATLAVPTQNTQHLSALMSQFAASRAVAKQRVVMHGAMIVLEVHYVDLLDRPHSVVLAVHDPSSGVYRDVRRSDSDTFGEWRRAKEHVQFKSLTVQHLSACE